MYPKGKNKIADKPKMKINIVIGANNGTIKIFTNGETKEKYPKL